MADDSLSAVAATRDWLRRNAADLLILTGVWVAASAVLYLLASGHESPRRYQDEFLYWALSKNFAAGHGLVWRGVSQDLRSSLYPLLISPAFKFSQATSTRYGWVHAINSLMITATVFPAYFATRSVASRRWGWLIVAFVLAMPAMNYAGIIGTETLALPACTLAFAAILMSCRDPRGRNTALAFAAIALAFYSRAQLVVLPAVYALTVILTAALRGRGDWRAYLRSQRSALSVFGVLALAAAVLVAVQGSRATGIYASAFQHHFSVSTAWFWLRAFAADSVFVCAIVPAVAALALFGARRNRVDPAVGPLLALTASATLVLVLQATWFSTTSVYLGRELHLFFGRYILYLVPLYFVCLAAAATRVTARAAAVGTAIAVCLLALFPADALNVPFSYDAFDLSYVGFLVEAHDGWLAHVGIGLAVVGLVLGSLYAVGQNTRLSEDARKYGRGFAIGGALLLMVLAQAKSWSYAWLYSSDGIKQEPQPIDFIDQHATSDVGLILAAGNDRLQAFQAEFWNPRIARWYSNPKPPLSSPNGSSPQCPLAWTTNGTIRPGGCGVPPQWWYLDSSSVTVRFRGELTRVSGRLALHDRTATLTKVTQPARLFSIAGGRDVRTSTLQNRFTLLTFLGAGGEMRTTASAPAGDGVVKAGDKTFRLGRRPQGIKLPLAAGEQQTLLSQSGNAAVKLGPVYVRESGGRWIRVS